MTRRTLLSCTLLLAVAVGTSGPHASCEASDASIGLILRCQDHRVFYIPGSRDSEYALSQAERFFRRHAPSLASRPGRWRRESRAWRLVELLEDTAFRTHLEKSLMRFNRKTALIRLELSATSDRWPGVETRENGRRVLMIEDDTLARACHTDGDLRALLLHELAHMVDQGRRSQDDNVMEDSQLHGPRDVLTPTDALLEGWADYWMRSSGVAGSEKFEELWHQPVPFLFVRTAMAHDQDGKQLPLAALNLSDYVSNALAVSHILAELAQMPPGESSMCEAVETSWRTENPTLADVLAAFLQKNPQLRQLVRDAVTRWTDHRGSVYEVSRLLAGLLPRGVARDRCPRSQ